MNQFMREPSVAAARLPSRHQGLRAAGAVALLAFALAGCGQKGPLTLPAGAAPASAPAATR